MLTEERFAKILSILESMGSVTVQQLMTELNASESTIRRDLNALDANGQLTKVHGGAILKTMAPALYCDPCDQRYLFQTAGKGTHCTLLLHRIW